MGAISAVVGGTGGGTPSSDRQNVLNANDLVSSVTWLDFGTYQERIDNIVYTSATYPTKIVTKTYSYTLVGANYRLDTTTWSVT